MREKPERLELGELAANRGGRDVEAASVDESPRPDRLSGNDVFLDHEPENLPFAGGKLHCGSDGSGGSRRFHVHDLRLASGEELGRDASAKEASSPRQAERASAVRGRQLHEPSLNEPGDRAPVERLSTCLSSSGSSRRRPSISRSRARVSASSTSSSRGGDSPWARAPR